MANAGTKVMKTQRKRNFDFVVSVIVGRTALRIFCLRVSLLAGNFCSFLPQRAKLSDIFLLNIQKD